MRSRVVRVPPLATHRRRRSLVLKGSFLVLPRTGSPGHDQPSADVPEISGEQPFAPARGTGG
jgi:hypothetical protein